VPRRAVEELGDDRFGITPVGSGPFRVVPEGADLSSGFVLEAFDGWYGGRPFLDRIEVTLIAEPSSRISALEAGDVDMLDIVPAGRGRSVGRAIPTSPSSRPPAPTGSGLGMNMARPPWDAVDARMAVAKAIDREDLIERALFGRAAPAIGAIPPAFALGLRPAEETTTPQSYDLEAAKALAETAGLVGLTTTILATVDNPRPAEVLRTQLQDLGLDVQVEQLQAAAWNERWLAGDFDWVVNGSVVDADPDDGHWNFFFSEGPWNSQGYTSERADELLRAARAIPNPRCAPALPGAPGAAPAGRGLRVPVPHRRHHRLPPRRPGLRPPIPEMRYLETVWLDR
jgi:peptide/nickel transport system substrate-binding protein